LNPSRNKIPAAAEGLKAQLLQLFEILDSQKQNKRIFQLVFLTPTFTYFDTFYNYLLFRI